LLVNNRGFHGAGSAGAPAGRGPRDHPKARPAGQFAAWAAPPARPCGRWSLCPAGPGPGP